MARQVQHRRGSTADHNAFTGAVGEVTIDTTKKTAVVHDGVTAGGIPLARGDRYKAIDGNAANPVYTFENDPDTGFYRSNTNELAWATGGVQRGYVGPDGVTNFNNGIKLGTGAKLDHYEEGAFTPALKFGGFSSGMTYSVQGGHYTKVGRLVHVTGRVVLTAKGTSTGAAKVQGLPFNIKNENKAYSGAAIGQLKNITFADFLWGQFVVSSDDMELWETTNAGVQSALDDTNFANNSELIFSGVYMV